MYRCVTITSDAELAHLLGACGVPAADLDEEIAKVKHWKSKLIVTTIRYEPEDR